MKLDNDVVASILRTIISDLDGKLDQFLLCNPYDDTDQYPEIAADFIEMYENFGK